MIVARCIATGTGPGLVEFVAEVVEVFIARAQIGVLHGQEHFGVVMHDLPERTG